MKAITPLLLLQAHPLEGFFFGSGKAMVVAGVGVIIVIGIGIWLATMEWRLRSLSDRLNRKHQDQNTPVR